MIRWRSTRLLCSGLVVVALKDETEDDLVATLGLLSDMAAGTTSSTISSTPCDTVNDRSSNTWYFRVSHDGGTMADDVG